MPSPYKKPVAYKESDPRVPGWLFAPPLSGFGWRRIVAIAPDDEPDSPYIRKSREGHGQDEEEAHEHAVQLAQREDRELARLQKVKTDLLEEFDKNRADMTEWLARFLGISIRESSQFVDGIIDLAVAKIDLRNMKS